MQPKKFSEYTPIEETDGSEIIPILKDGENGAVAAENLPVSLPTQAAIDAATSGAASGLATHVANTSNPHAVTKTQVGLSNVDNTSDADKPVSTAQQTAIDAKVADAINNGTTTVAPSQNAVFDALALKAVDADVVHDTGDETIAGVKTFSNDLTAASLTAVTTVEAPTAVVDTFMSHNDTGLSFNTGNTTGIDSAGMNVDFQAGSANGEADGGSVIFAGGVAGENSTGGPVRLIGGTGTATGATGGDIELMPGEGDAIDGLIKLMGATEVSEPINPLNVANKAYTDLVSQMTRSFSVTVALESSGMAADYICDGTNDTEQIQAATDAVVAAGGGTVYIRNGTYTIMSTIEINRLYIAGSVASPDTYIRYVGDGFFKSATGTIAGTALQAGVNLTHMFYCRGMVDPVTNADIGHGLAFEYMTLDGGLANGFTTTNLMTLENWDGCIVNFARLRGADCSINTVWNSTTDPTGPTIPGGLFISNAIISGNGGGIGINLEYQTQCWFTNLWMSTSSTADTWIKCLGGGKLKFNSIEFNAAGCAFSFNDSATRDLSDVIIVGCMFQVGSGNKSWRENRTNSSSKRFAIGICTMGVGVTYDQLVHFETNSVQVTGFTEYYNNLLLGTRTFALTDAANIATDASRGNIFTVTLGGDRVLDAPTNPTNGQRCVWRFTQDATGNRTITPATGTSGSFRFGTDLTGITLSTTANKTDYMLAQYNSTDSRWDVLALQRGY